MSPRTEAVCHRLEECSWEDSFKQMAGFADKLEKELEDEKHENENLRHFIELLRSENHILSEEISGGA